MVHIATVWLIINYLWDACGFGVPLALMLRLETATFEDRCHNKGPWTPRVLDHLMFHKHPLLGYSYFSSELKGCIGIAPC